MSSSSGVPSNQPSPPQGPSEKQESQKQPQAKREDIPPGFSSGQADVESMTESVKNEKRKRELEENEEGVSEPATKRVATEEESPEEKLVALRAQITQYLGEPPEEANDTTKLANFCFQKIRERVQEFDPLKTEEIIAIRALLFGSELSAICIASLEEPIDPINPHPAYVINSLYHCLTRLEGKRCKEARQEYLNQHQLIPAYFSIPRAQRTQASQAVFLQHDPQFMEKLNGASVYTARELFGTQNVNPAYILHDEQRRRAWVFKPVSSQLSPEEAQMFGGMGQKPYSSGNPQEMSAYAEHAAYCLNYDKQLPALFPVPFTCLVEMNGDFGSIQMFVEGPEVQITGPILQEAAFSRDLQAMLIFDLMFINCDRHQGNFLAKELDIHRLYAIDHDACLQIGSGKPMKLQYLQHLPASGFQEEVKQLFSPAAIAEYKNIIARLEIENADQLGQWFDYVAHELTNPDERTLEQLAKDIMQEYETNYQ